MRVEEIPYYNCDFSGQKGIKGFITVSDKVMRKIWDRVKGNKYPSVRSQDCIKNGDVKFTDFLNVKQFIKE